MGKTYTKVTHEELLRVLPKNGEVLSTTQIAIRLQVGNGTVADRMKALVEDREVEKVQMNGKQWGYRKVC
jgi:DNA-binding Lrp family transcriptional regulator